MEDRVPGIHRSCRKKRSIDSSFYLERAKHACMKNEISLAHKNFVLYFESLDNPLEAPMGVQKVFTKLVCKIGGVLEAMCNIEELLKYYIQALNFFPDNYMILTNLGAYMFKVNEIDIARRYLERAVKVNKDYLPAEVNLMHVKWHQLPRWHFSMLNDKRRNLAYDKAIAQQINLGYKDVFDIGSGCGLLSLSASRHKDVNVTAIEENKVLFNMSEEIFSANGFEKVKRIQMNSNYITEPPDKCNLLVTEVFDVALFGEKALDTILHALTVLRTEDDFKIIPYRAKVYVAGISSAGLLAKHEITSAASLRLLDLPPNVTIRVRDPEPYEAEHLAERGDVAYLSRPLEIIDVDFRDAQQLFYVLYGHDELECRSAGVVHAFAVWFDLFLTEDVSITTNPFDEERVRCWEQAVIYLDRPVQVKEGDKLPISFSVQDSKLSIMHLNCEKDTRLQFRVSKEIISFLNDEGLVDSIVRMSQKIRLSDIVVVDYNPLPLLGILLAKHRNCKVYHTVRDGTDKLFLDYVVTHNNVPLERFVLLDDLEMSVERQKCLLFLDVVDCDGSLGSSVYRIQDGETASLRVPQAVRVFVQLIHSPYIDHCNRVADENVLDFRIGQFMNEYSGYEHPNLEKFPYSERSQPVAFPLGYNGRLTEEVVVTETGLVNALYVWYEFQLYNDVKFCTKDSTHYKKTCFFLSSPKSVEAGDKLCIKMDVHESDMKFSL